MKDDTFWSDWFWHDGKGCPVPGQLVDVKAEGPGGQKYEGAFVAPWRDEIWRSEFYGVQGECNGKVGVWARIISYRVRRYPEAERLIASIREMEDA